MNQQPKRDRNQPRTIRRLTTRLHEARQENDRLRAEIERLRRELAATRHAADLLLSEIKVG